MKCRLDLVVIILLLSLFSCRGEETVVCSEATFDPPSGTYRDPLTLTLATTTPGAQIRYTTNRVMPNELSPLYEDPITVSASTVVLAVVQFEGAVDSEVVRASYQVGWSAETLAGTAGRPGRADGTGAEACFDVPSGIVSDAGFLYVCDLWNHSIRRIEPATGAVTTFAGVLGESGSADGVGSAARFTMPSGITTDGTYLYIAESARIRKISIATGAVSTLTTGTGSYLGITVHGSDLYVCDNGRHVVYRIDSTSGVSVVFAGSEDLEGYNDAVGSAARFSYPDGIANDGQYLYVADSGNNVIRKIEISSATVTTIAGQSPYDGAADGIGADARFQGPSGLALVGNSLYVCSGFGLRRVDLATCAVTTLGYAAGTYETIDGRTAAFGIPGGIAAVGTDLFVADQQYHTVRRLY